MGKYFKYAIGEILLVVIGILIALQINNWNEDRKQHFKEQELFNNLKLDFESRLHELMELNEAREIGLAAIKQLSHYIVNAKNRPEVATLDTLLATLENGYLFNEQFKMLDVVFSTGLINDIENKQLKRLLLDWPQQVEEMLEEQRLHSNIQFNYLKPLQYKHISLRRVLETFDFRNYNLEKGTPIAVESDYNALFADPVFENVLADLQLCIQLNYLDSNTLINTAESIIEILNRELQE
jgi:hypothetical protein